MKKVLTLLLLAFLSLTFQDHSYSQELRQSKDPMVIRVVHLEHADAEHLASILSPFLTKDGKIVAYSPTNTLIIKDRESLVKELVRIIKGDAGP